MESNEYLKILHFNDVYVLEEREQAVTIEGTDVFTRGGAARFVTAMKERKCDQKLVLFSGDVLSPSLLSTYVKGMQFVEVFCALNVQVSCIGNHDVFDYGVDNFLEFDRASRAFAEEKTRIPNTWLMANFFLEKGQKEKKAIADLAGTHIIEKNGRKIGIIGLCDESWIGMYKSKQADVEPSYESFVDHAKKLSKKLRGEGCQYIIALTHMDTKNDRKLAQSGKGYIDLILGGHDHISLFEDATEN